MQRESHLRQTLNDYVDHYHIERNHQGLRNELITAPAVDDAALSGSVLRRRRLGDDENLTELYRFGQIGDQEVEETEERRHPCMFREYMADENGQETHDFWEAASLTSESRQMPVTLKGADPRPGGHTATCEQFYPPLSHAATPPAFIDLKLRMRPMGLDVLNDLVSTNHLAADIPARMPTFTVFSRRATFNPETRSFVVASQNDDPTLGDCTTYRCLLDPQSQECLAK